MTDGSEKCNRQLAFELQNSHVCEKNSKINSDNYIIEKQLLNLLSYLLCKQGTVSKWCWQP